MAKVPLWRFMQNLLAQDADKYFGAQASPDDRDPAEFDCAELVEWAIEFLGWPRGLQFPSHR